MTEHGKSTLPGLPAVIVSCAVTGGMTVPGQSAAIPVTPREIVDSALEAHLAGAVILHVHVRDPATGAPTADLGLFREVIAELRARCDAIIQPTTGGGVGMTAADRARVVVECKPELATFNAGSFNFGLFAVRNRANLAPWEDAYLESTRDYIFRNTFADMERLASIFRESGTRPELEVYDVGHLYNVHHLLERGLLDPPVHIQFVLGVLGATAASPAELFHMWQTASNLFGANGFTWSVAGVGYPAEFHLAAIALTLGGHVRFGLEDNLTLSAGRRAVSNAELVEKGVGLATILDRPIATAEVARGLLCLEGRS